MSAILERARHLRAIIEDNATIMTDEEAIDAVELFPRWSADGVSYKVADRRRYGENLYKCLQDHVSQDGWDPESAPSLWAKILPGQDDTEIGEWEQPDSTNPYMAGDRVTHNGKTWESDIDNNVWEPGVYGWTEVVEG